MMTAFLALPSGSRSTAEHKITNIFKPLASPAESENNIAMLVFAITGVIFVGVAGLIAYTIWRFRQPIGTTLRSHRKSTAVTRLKWPGRWCRFSSCLY